MRNNLDINNKKNNYELYSLHHQQNFSLQLWPRPRHSPDSQGLVRMPKIVLWGEKPISRDLILPNNKETGSTFYSLNLLPLPQSVFSLVPGTGLLGSKVNRGE